MLTGIKLVCEGILLFFGIVISVIGSCRFGVFLADELIYLKKRDEIIEKRKDRTENCNKK